MPIILDDSVLEGAQSTGKDAIDTTDAAITTLSDAKAITPKYFSKELNGNGRGPKGRISSALNPAQPDLTYTRDINSIVRKHTVRNDKTTIHHIPTSAVYAGAEQAVLEAMRHQGNKGVTRAVTNVAETALLLTHPDDNNGLATWVSITPQLVLIRSEESVDIDGKKSTEHNTVVAYRVEVLHSFTDYVVDQDTDDVTLTATSSNVRLLSQATGSPASVLHGNGSITTLSEVEYTYDVVELLSTHLNLTTNNVQTLNTWLNDFNVYQALCDQAEAVSSDKAITGIIELLETYLTHLPAPHLGYAPGDTPVIQKIAVQMNYLESFTLSLENYREIYQVLSKHMATHPDLTKQLISQNMQLALNDNLHSLADIRDQLPTAIDDPQRPYPMPDYYSSQQRQAITAADPLTIISSGAGTGKSTVILERIRYVQHCGYDPATTTVLSFTNAAANNIAEKNPGVRSCTFAAQLNEIYAHNFPDHQLSNLDTIVNSIDIYYVDELRRQEPIVTSFRRLLRDVAKQNGEARTALTKLNNFVEYHLNECIAILNRIRQVSLELQNIFCYQLIDQLTEPFLAPKFVIVDEVQDTSIFEFVYILRYVAKHRANLYFVGDASQTLYEFRAANPKALNSLEASGVFGVHRLTTNYRSNQEILDFANVHLSEIDANQYAKIQLNANDLRQVTSASLQEKITVKHHPTKNVASVANDLPGVLMEPDVKTYINDCLSRGEKVAFLSNTRREAQAMGETLEAMYPDRTVLSLISDRMYYNSLFSKYVTDYWDEVCAVAPADAPYVFTVQVNAHLSKLKPTSTPAQSSRVAAQAQATLARWWSDNQSEVTGLVQAFSVGALSREDFFTNLRENILQHEIKLNNAKQVLTSERNRARKEEASGKADMFTSTIHGVKGLEFDNVVLVHKPVDNEDESDKRLYYVALTRAKNTEFIIAVGKQTIPRLVTDYETLVKRLSDQEAAADVSNGVALLSNTASTPGDSNVPETVKDSASTDEQDNQDNQDSQNSQDTADIDDANDTSDTVVQYSSGAHDEPNLPFAAALAHLKTDNDDRTADNISSES